MSSPRRLLPALAAAALLLAACSSVIAGRGAAVSAAPGSGRPSVTGFPTPTVGPSPSSSTPARPTQTGAAPTAPNSLPASTFAALPHRPLTHIPVHTVIGDPATANMCSGISLTAFEKWGVTVPHWLQYAGQCSIDVLPNEHTAFQLSVLIEPAAGFSPDGSKRVTLRSGVYGYTFPYADGDCQRAVKVGANVFTIDSFAALGTVSSAILCAASTQMMHEAGTAYSHGPLPRRLLGVPTLTRFDMCSLIVDGNVQAVRGFDDIFLDPEFEDGSCHAESDDLEMYLGIVFYDRSEPLPTTKVTVDGHSFRRDVDAKDSSCELVSTQGQTADHRTVELLDIRVVSDDDDSAALTVCPAAEKAAVAVLGAAGLK